MKNTSISLGNYFDQFVQTQVSAGRYKNVSEVIRAGLRLLENEESKVIALRNAIQKGIDSGIAHDFDPDKHLQELKARKKTMAKYELTNEAVVDLSNIWDYTFDNWSEKQDDRYFKMLLDTCQDIADNPELGKNNDGITSDLFGLKYNCHIIFYRKLIDKPIEITRILHERMDLKNRITE